jgi:type I restriction enzyme S subunit
MTEHDGVLDVTQLRRTSPEIALAYKRSELKSGDVVVTIGPSYGKTMIVPPELAGANLTQGTARVAVASHISPRYIYWALQTRLASSFWEAAVDGATFRALNLEPLSKTPVPSWPRRSQMAIATYLDTETARIDALIEK